METLYFTALAFAGGVILNVMPCVLPVVSLKVFHTIEAFGDPDHDPKAHGLAYMTGTVAAFLGFAVVVVTLRASGDVMGWGMHFQHPPFVAGLTAIIFAFALNSLGVFELSVSGRGNQKSGVWASFGNGIFAAIMSTPCTAPFLATAAVFALAADTAAWQTLLLFAAIGAGLAAPYTLVGFFPMVGKMLPRPGAWMVTFKQLMGFSLLGTALWLFGAFQSQVSRDSAFWFLGFLLSLSIALWVMPKVASPLHSGARRWGARAVLTVLIGLSGVQMITFDAPAKAIIEMAEGEFDDKPVLADGHIDWRPFAPDRMSTEHKRKRPVFVDFTADWCAACKTNERVFLETDTVRSALEETNILPMQADMTNDNPAGDAALEALKRNGIPVYAIYLPDGKVDLLPQVITADMVSERLRKAAKRWPRVVSRN